MGEKEETRKTIAMLDVILSILKNNNAPEECIKYIKSQMTSLKWLLMKLENER